MIQDLQSHMNICEVYVCGMRKLRECLQFTSPSSFEIMRLFTLNFGDLYFFKLCIQSETIIMAPFQISLKFAQNITIIMPRGLS